MNEPKISFIILTWNSEKFIEHCLDALSKCRWADLEIIIIDNGSMDETVSILRQYQTRFSEEYFRVVFLEKNCGTTYSRNLGLKMISPDTRYVCILDSDAFINREALEIMISALESDPRNGICGPSMENLDGMSQLTAKKIPTALLKFFKAFPVAAVQRIGERMERYQFAETSEVVPVGYLISACWLIKASVLPELGFLDEKIFYSPEDVEYCVRAWKKKIRVVYCPKAHIIHAVQRISKRKLISRHNFEHLKGLIYFFKKYHLFFSSAHIQPK